MGVGCGQGHDGLIASLQPNARRLIVVDSIPQSSGSVEVEVRSQFDKLSDRMSLVYIKNQPLPRCSPPSRCAGRLGRAVHPPMIRTPTEAMSQLEGSIEIVRATRVPVYGMVEGLVGGVIGGYVMPSSADGQGHRRYWCCRCARHAGPRSATGEADCHPASTGSSSSGGASPNAASRLGSVASEPSAAIWREHPLLAMAVSAAS